MAVYSRISRKVSHFASGWTNPGSAGGGFSFGTGRRGSYGRIGHGTDAIRRRDEHTNEDADEQEDDASEDVDCRRSAENGRGGAMEGEGTEEVVVRGAGRRPTAQPAYVFPNAPWFINR